MFKKLFTESKSQDSIEVQAFKKTFAYFGMSPKYVEDGGDQVLYTDGRQYPSKGKIAKEISKAYSEDVSNAEEAIIDYASEVSLEELAEELDFDVDDYIDDYDPEDAVAEMARDYANGSDFEDYWWDLPKATYYFDKSGVLTDREGGRHMDTLEMIESYVESLESRMYDFYNAKNGEFQKTYKKFLKQLQKSHK